MRVIDKNGNVRQGGVITSVGLTMPAEFSVTGSPLLANGTLAVSRTTQSANQVLAGPASGSAAAPTFRGLVGGDLGIRGTSTASAGTVTLPTDGAIIPITGTTTITTITAPAAPTKVVLEFASAGCQVTNNNTTLKLNGNYLSTAGSVLVLEHDGTNWHEVARTGKPMFCRVQHSANVTFATSTWQVVPLDTDVSNLAGMHSTVTNNSRVTIPSGGAGLYFLLCVLAFAPNATGARYGRMYLNPTGAGVGTFLCEDTQAGLSGDSNVMTASTISTLADGDFVELHGWQSSGANLLSPAAPTAAQTGTALKTLAGDVKSMTVGLTKLLNVVAILVQRGQSRSGGPP